MRRLRVSWLVLGALAIIWVVGALLTAAQAGQAVYLLKVEGVIDPITAGYVTRGIHEAQEAGAGAVVIQLDTPGGLESAMRSIIQEMMSASVPVVVYVAPPGARAGSAGAFITLAGHVAAMAPGTNIGAATPVDIGGGEIPDTMRTKLINDSAAYIRAIAEQRGRNAGWAEEAVRSGVSITAREALELGVIDLMAPDLPSLLSAIDGRTVRTLWGERTLATRSATVQPLEMSLPERFLHLLVDPSIAYLLLTIGIWALVAEFYNPGAVLPGVTGILCLILAFIALGSLPVNWGGVILIVLAIGLFILDVKVAGFALSVGGAIAFILGSLFLFRPLTPTPPAMPPLSVAPWLVAVTTAGLVGFFLFVVSAGVRAQRAKPATGIQTVIGATGRVTSDLDPVGTVLVRSEDWTAEAVDGPIQAGEAVTVVGVEGVRLKVRRSFSEERAGRRE